MLTKKTSSDPQGGSEDVVVLRHVYIEHRRRRHCPHKKRGEGIAPAESTVNRFDVPWRYKSLGYGREISAGSRAAPSVGKMPLREMTTLNRTRANPWSNPNTGVMRGEASRGGIYERHPTEHPGPLQAHERIVGPV